MNFGHYKALLNVVLPDFKQEPEDNQDFYTKVYVELSSRINMRDPNDIEKVNYFSLLNATQGRILGIFEWEP